MDENFDKKEPTAACIAARIICFALLFLLGVYACGELVKPVTIGDNAYLETQETSALSHGEAEVVFSGTSHMEYGISPMRIYENTGIVTYNMATSSQPIELSYYMAMKAAKKGAKLFVLDASSLFFEGSGESQYRYVLDSENPSVLKWELSKILVENQLKNDGSKELIDECLYATVPLLRYHDRWKELQEVDFTVDDWDYYLQGYIMYPAIADSGIRQESMNEVAEHMLSEASASKYSRTLDTDWTEENWESQLYKAEIPENSLDYLLKIRDLLKENNCKLLLVKIPTVNYPQLYSSSWTLERSRVVKEMAAECDVEFLDLLYDVDLGIDWATDTLDGGYHLNYLGMQKVTDYMSEYLSNLDYLTPKVDENYEKKLVKYNMEDRVAQILTTTTLPDYLQLLKDEGNSIDIFMASSGDMRAALTEEDMEALGNLGLEYDFANMQERNSYVAIIDSGQVTYEGASNRALWYDTTMASGAAVSVGSYGWYEGEKAYIYINGANRARSETGLNIVVYDHETGIVIDSVRFDTTVENHTCTRSSWDLLNQYQQYLFTHDVDTEGGDD